jgi:hypothetical protein
MSRCHAQEILEKKIGLRRISNVFFLSFVQALRNYYEVDSVKNTHTKQKEKIVFCFTINYQELPPMIKRLICNAHLKVVIPPRLSGLVIFAL